MKITNIKIENFGPFVSENNITIDSSSRTKRVILIGGKNGAGKTTLFNAIRIGMYGCRAFGFETDNSKYIEIISQMINNNARLERSGRASICISILMDDGKYDYQYQFERSWKLTTKAIKEELVITRNGVSLGETERSDFESYLLQLIPPDMFKFYFFDGESISNFIFNGVKNTDFKEAFLKLCGLDTMELIYENFDRISSSRKKDTSGAYLEFQTAKEQLKVVDIRKSEAEECYKQITNKIVEIDEALAKNEQDYLQRGGISKKEYHSMLSQISKEEARREENRKWLKDVANDVIPFVILDKQLDSLKDQLAIEDEIEATQALKRTLESKKTQSKLTSTFNSVGINFSEDLTLKVIDVLTNSLVDGSENQILNVSKQEHLSLLAKINNIQAFDKSRVQIAVNVIENSLKVTKNIRKKLDKSDASGADSYFEIKESLLTKKNQFLQDLLSCERQLETLKTEIGVAQAQAKKAQQKYEDFLKVQSVNDVTAKALLAFSELQKRLYKKYTSDVENAFRQSFNSLINKSDLIDGIKIDEQLQVYPYKLKKFKRKDLDTMIQSGEAFFIEQLGYVAYEAFIGSNESTNELEIPVEVKQKLSAGEKQIFIMALYQALSTLNKVSVPYIIDTPFARIDAEHRQNILNNFFMKLKGQMIILSTDEEIVGEYESCINDSICDYFLLQHKEGMSSTSIIKNVYFGGAKV